MNTPSTSKLAMRLANLHMALAGAEHMPWRGPLKWIPRPLQLKAAERLFNALFRQPLDDGELDFLEGATLRLQVRDLGFDWSISKNASRLVFYRGEDGAETTFSGDSRHFLLLASRREDPDTLFFQRQLIIEGDTELGLAVKNLIDSMDPEILPALVNAALTFGADFVEALASMDVQEDSARACSH